MNVDFDKLDIVVKNCCKTTNSCPNCVESNCLMGYCKNVLSYYFESHNVILPHGMEKVPKNDFKSYSRQNLIDSIVEVLMQCKQCNEDHERDCIVNIIRVSLETALFGRNMGKYEGNSLSYIIRVMDFDPSTGNEILERYKEAKSLLK